AALKPIIDSHCAFSASGKWTFQTTLAEIKDKIAGLKDSKVLQTVEVVSRTPSQRAALLAFNDGDKNVFVSGNDLRRQLGYNRLKRTLFSVIQTGEDVTFFGRGFGHGSGLCQWGARFMAQKGSKFRDILAHYYPTAKLREVTPSPTGVPPVARLAIV